VTAVARSSRTGARRAADPRQRNEHRQRQKYQPRARKARPGTWTDERILDALRDWFETFGETPLSYEWAPSSGELLGLPAAGGREWKRQHPRWPSTGTVCKHFATWASAIQAANLPPARAIAPGRGFAERVDAARRLSAKGHGTAEIAALLEISPRTVRNYLRAGVCRDCRTAVITTDRCRSCAARRANQPHWTHEQVRRALSAWVRQVGRPPTSGDWTPTTDTRCKWGREYPRWPSYETVRTLFGSWSKGLAAADLRPRRTRWDRDRIAVALREFAAASGRTPTRADLECNEELPSPGTVRAHLGSLQAALESANLPVARRRWDRDRIVAAIVRYAEEHDRLPTSRDWRRSTGVHPHATTVLQQFGSWSAALAAAGSSHTSGTTRRARRSK
jgi:hypothetical protein